MAYFLFKKWPEELFYIKRSDFINVESKIALTFVPITLDNIDIVRNIRGQQYVKQFEELLSYGDFGIYALHDGIPVGYGWIKHTGSVDYFYKIKDVAYLCRFYVIENQRGNSIYPAMISYLIKNDANNDYYIDIESGNIASEKGILKVGFKRIGKYSFIRGFKHTFNMKTLRPKNLVL